jgi:Ca-activated chloride channel family protein
MIGILGIPIPTPDHSNEQENALHSKKQNMIVFPDFARGALDVLGQLQANEFDDYRDAEPGKSSIISPYLSGRGEFMKNYLPARFAALCICLSTLAVPFFAQSAEPAVSQRPPAERAVVRVETSLVSIPITVHDRQGKFVSGLRKDDFRVFEDEVEQEIEWFAAVEAPFHLVLLLDSSRSTVFRLEEIQQAALDFVDQLRPQDSVMVISFDDAVNVDAEFTNDHRQLRYAIRNIRTGTTTRLYDAIELAITERLDEVEGRKAIVLFTEGTDTASRLASERATVARVEESDALVYVIRYDTEHDLEDLVLGRGVRIGGMKSGRQREPGYLRGLAKRSGGRFYQAENMPSLNRAFAQISGDLRNQYWITYYPTKAARDGSYRRLRVSVNRSDVILRAREGYRASAEESALGPDPAPGRMDRPTLKRVTQ